MVDNSIIEAACVAVWAYQQDRSTRRENTNAVFHWRDKRLPEEFWQFIAEDTKVGIEMALSLITGQGVGNGGGGNGDAAFSTHTADTKELRDNQSGVDCTARNDTQNNDTQQEGGLHGHCG